MALLPVQPEDALGGGLPAFSIASVDGDTWLNLVPEPEVWLLITTADAEVTVETRVPCAFGDHPDHVETLPAGSFFRWRRFPFERFTGGDGLAKIISSSPSTTQIAIVQPKGLDLE